MEEQRRSRPTAGPASARVRLLAVALPAVVAALSLTAVLVVLRPFGTSGRAGPEAGPGRAPEVARAAPLPVPEPGPSPEQALEAMRQRYRPGPFVRLVGLLPSAQARSGSIGWLRRFGRTIDNPWLVRHGELRPTRAPDASPGTERPSLAFAPGEEPSVPLTVVPGAPNVVRLRVGHPTGRRVEGFHVAFGSYLGHFFLPASGGGQDGELGTVYVGEADLSTLEIGIDAAVTPEGHPLPPGQPHPVTLYVGAVDEDGRVSDYVTRQLQVLPVGTGDLEVTLTMSQATDLDLYVVEPTGVAIYYRNTSSLAGGHLDLDANAACSHNLGVNNEHVYWPRGRAPSGVYAVRVANYTSCVGGASVDYQVTVRSCGETAVLAGSFAGPGNRAQCTVPPGADQGWCQEVVTFVVTPCEG